MITFDPKTKRYRKNGKLIAAGFVPKQITRLMRQTEKEMRDAGESLTKGEIDIPTWQNKIGKLAKAALIAAAVIGYGGRSQMNSSRWGKVGVKVREQNKYLNNFARKVERGAVSDVQIINRSSLYAKAARSIYFTAEKQLQTEAGKTECRRLINSKEGCPECAEVAAQGWISIDEMPGIGELICGNFDLCELEYRTG